MVIYAKNINLAGSGDFSGLLVAGNSLSTVPQPSKRINIRGGIVTAGSEETSLQGAPGTVLHNVDTSRASTPMESIE